MTYMLELKEMDNHNDSPPFTTPIFFKDKPPWTDVVTVHDQTHDYMENTRWTPDSIREFMITKFNEMGHETFEIEAESIEI